MRKTNLELWQLLGFIALCLCTIPSVIVQRAVSQPLSDPSFEQSPNEPAQVSPPVTLDFGRQPSLIPVSKGASCTGTAGNDLNLTCVDGVWFSERSLSLGSEAMVDLSGSPIFVNGSVSLYYPNLNIDLKSKPYEERCVNHALITATECISGQISGAFYPHKKDNKFPKTSFVLFEHATACPGLSEEDHREYLSLCHNLWLPGPKMLRFGCISLKGIPTVLPRVLSILNALINHTTIYQRLHSFQRLLRPPTKKLAIDCHLKKQQI